MNTNRIINQIKKLHLAIEHDSKESLNKAIQIGEILEQQKQELGHGNFIKWIKTDLPFAERTARRYLNLHKNKTKIEEHKVETLVDAYNLLSDTQSKLPYQQNSTTKDSTIYTPKPVSDYLHNILSPVIDPAVVLDPAIGKGSLTNPWKNKKSTIIGVDIEQGCKKYCDTFIQGKFEDIETWDFEHPDLIVCNPPFNDAAGRSLYPEVFLRKCFLFFGEKVKVVMVVPMGFRLNQRLESERWKYLSNSKARITSIISLPLDCFEALFHTEILCFNIPKLKPHYFLFQG